MFFDLLNPEYIASAPFTFAFKFLMACVCGILAGKAQEQKNWRCIVGAVVGACSYVVLYIGKSFIESFYIAGIPFDVVWVTLVQKTIVSTVNGILAAALSSPLYFALRPALKRFQFL